MVHSDYKKHLKKKHFFQLSSLLTPCRYTGGGTNTEKALEFARTTSFQTQYGMRKNAAHIAIVVTDGKCLALCMLGNFSCRLLTFFKINLFKILFQEHYQSVQQLGSRSNLTFCRAWFRSKLFANVINRQQNSLWEHFKELTYISQM